MCMSHLLSIYLSSRACIDFPSSLDVSFSFGRKVITNQSAERSFPCSVSYCFIATFAMYVLTAWSSSLDGLPIGMRWDLDSDSDSQLELKMDLKAGNGKEQSGCLLLLLLL
jgi:hypothetical protein